MPLFSQQLNRSLDTLRSCPRELYINFFLKFCVSYSYFSISQILVIYLHQEFGLSDFYAGACYGLWGASSTMWGLATAWINDKLGVRRSLMVGFVFSIVATTMLGLTRSRIVIFLTLFCVMPIANSLGIPMLTIGIRRYTTKENRGFAYGLFYSVMNIAAFVSGPIIDIFNIGEPQVSSWSGNRSVIMTSNVVSIISLAVTYLYLREIKVTESHEIPAAYSSVAASSVKSAIHSGKKKYASKLQHVSWNDQKASSCPEMDLHQEMVVIELNSVVVATDRIDTKLGAASDVEIDGGETEYEDRTEDRDADSQEESGCGADLQKPRSKSGVESFSPETRSGWEITHDLIRSVTFWRFMGFTLLLTNLNAIFRHLDATLPTYLMRSFGPDIPKGTIYSINPFMIMFLTPLVAAYTTSYPHFDMIKYGGYITAASPFFLVVSTSVWATVCMIVVFSFGESIWSPRTYDYTMSVAPEGREASFATLAAAPLFLAKVPVGLLSGFLISHFLPEDGPNRGQTLWLIVALMTMASPLMITMCERWIREPEAGTGKNGCGDIDRESELMGSAHEKAGDKPSLTLLSATVGSDVVASIDSISHWNAKEDQGESVSGSPPYLADREAMEGDLSYFTEVRSSLETAEASAGAASATSRYMRLATLDRRNINYNYDKLTQDAPANGG